MDHEGTKGGGHQMDFGRIAEDDRHARLEVVAATFLRLGPASAGGVPDPS